MILGYFYTILMFCILLGMLYHNNFVMLFCSLLWLVFNKDENWLIFMLITGLLFWKQ